MSLSEATQSFLGNPASWESRDTEQKRIIVLEMLRFVHLNADKQSQLETRKKIGFCLSLAASSSAAVEMFSHISQEELVVEVSLLVRSIGISEQCNPTGSVVRAMLTLDGIAEAVLTRDILDALAVCLCRTKRGTPCIEAWLIASDLLRFHKPVTAFILNNFEYFVGLMRECVQTVNFVARRQALRLLNALLGDPAYGRARLKLAESPALLCAVMHALHDPSHHIQFEAYHCLKVFLAKPNKKPAIRYLLACNRAGLADFLNEYSTGDARSDQQLDEEKSMLLQRLIAVEPLTHEEQVLLDV
jgi:hypothetical protein